MTSVQVQRGESTALGGLLVSVSPLTPERDSKATLVEEGRQGKRCSVGRTLRLDPGWRDAVLEVDHGLF